MSNANIRSPWNRYLYVRLSGSKRRPEGAHGPFGKLVTEGLQRPEHLLLSLFQWTCKLRLVVRRNTLQLVPKAARRPHFKGLQSMFEALCPSRELLFQTFRQAPLELRLVRLEGSGERRSGSRG